ncbi:hypothetical protein [Homoserinimonas hongtaonis]|uniref:hypothetical protein n=1 Tax=Homoserinimonas hongtaonis TaxID=2079791 RepID=UPI000D3B72EB|nr:hypothetical protein [Salinibacterium hongtaonis]AWB90094.1 hypothetical protein C2138_11570 [Salinibacterium hongtaonis]
MNKTLLSALAGHWWARALIVVAVTVVWFMAASYLGGVGHFARNHGTQLDAIGWLTAGVIGLGTYAALSLIRTERYGYLLPGWAFALPGVFSFANFVIIVSFDPQQPPPEVWAPYIWYPLTLGVIAAVLAHRHIRKLRTVTAVAAIAIAVLPWPVFFVVLVQRGCC